MGWAGAARVAPKRRRKLGSQEGSTGRTAPGAAVVSASHRRTACFTTTGPPRFTPRLQLLTEAQGTLPRGRCGHRRPGQPHLRGARGLPQKPPMQRGTWCSSQPHRPGPSPSTAPWDAQKGAGRTRERQRREVGLVAGPGHPGSVCASMQGALSQAAYPAVPTCSCPALTQEGSHCSDEGMVERRVSRLGGMEADPCLERLGLWMDPKKGASQSPCHLRPPLVERVFSALVPRRHLSKRPRVNGTTRSPSWG